MMKNLTERSHDRGLFFILRGSRCRDAHVNRFRLPPLQRTKHKASSEKQVQDKLPTRTTIASLDMAHDVERDQVKKIFMEAVYHLTGSYLMGRPLKLQLLSSNMHTPGRDLPSLGKKLPRHLRGTICVKGFDSALEIGTIRNMLKEHFEYKGLNKVVTPVNSDNASTGKAYIRYEVLSSFRFALQLHGSKLGGHQLSVTEWPEFPWSRKEGSKTTRQTTWTGKRTLFKYEGGDD